MALQRPANDVEQLVLRRGVRGLGGAKPLGQKQVYNRSWQYQSHRVCAEASRVGGVAEDAAAPVGTFAR